MDGRGSRASTNLVHTSPAENSAVFNKNGEMDLCNLGVFLKVIHWLGLHAYFYHGEPKLHQQL